MPRPLSARSISISRSAARAGVPAASSSVPSGAAAGSTAVLVPGVRPLARAASISVLVASFGGPLDESPRCAPCFAVFVRRNAWWRVRWRRRPPLSVTFVSTTRELVERAELAVGGPLLIQERKLVLVELPEELLPLDRFEILVVLVVVPRERNSEQPDVLALPRRLHVSGLPAALLDPLTDLVVVRRSLRVAQGVALLEARRGGSKIYAARPRPACASGCMDGDRSGPRTAFGPRAPTAHERRAGAARRRSRAVISRARLANASWARSSSALRSGGQGERTISSGPRPHGVQRSA